MNVSKFNIIVSFNILISYLDIFYKFESNKTNYFEGTSISNILFYECYGLNI